MSLRVVGIDPSLTASGIADSAGYCDVLGRPGITSLPLPQRVAAMDRLVQEILNAAGAADVYVIEGPAFSRVGGGAVERHALWWLLVRRLHRAEQHVAIVTPNVRARYATGKGNAPKTAVVDAVARRLSMFDTGGNDNACDAAVLCAMGCDQYGVPLAAMPATHRDALNKVAWPEIGAVAA